MTERETILVTGTCRHKFEATIPEGNSYFLTKDNLNDILSGRIAIVKCPVCNREVAFLHGFVINTFCERIGVYPVQWKDKIMSRQRNFDTIVFEEFGGPFINLKRHLENIGVLTDNRCLSDEYMMRLDKS